MQIFDAIIQIKEKIKSLKAEGKNIGFVPTMGTLHEGHLSLVTKSIEQCDITVCSIFVNPIQFNNKEDLEKYPRMFEQDRALLEEAGCDIIFCPSEKEMYPEPVTEVYEFGLLEKVMEGAFRPGHFNGVAIVVKKLFDIVEPHYAYFGEKDFQQLAIIKQLVKIHNLTINVIGCDIIRENDGLAMSSRNLRLNASDRKESTFIFKNLNKAKQMAIGGKSISEIKEQIALEFEKNPNFTLEYFEIANPLTLMTLDSFDQGQAARAFIAAYIGGIRLIDNIEINS